MLYRPEKIRIKELGENIIEIVSTKSGPIARIDLSNDVWRVSSKQKSDEMYMQSIELLGDTKKIEGISAHYRIGGVVPVLSSRETMDGAKITYDLDYDPEGLSDSFREMKREDKNKIITPRYSSYEHMRGLEIVDYDGCDVLDKKSGLTKVYNKSGNLIAEQIDENRLKVMHLAGSKFTELQGAKYAIVEQYGGLARFSHGNISIHRMKPKTVTVFNENNKEMAGFKFYENGGLQEAYKVNNEGHKRGYRHYNNSGKNDTFWYLLTKKIGNCRKF